MEQRPLGNTGLQVSALGFGCGAVGGLMVRGDAAEQRQAVSRAIDAGITYFDTAASYGDGLSEEHLGHVMRELGAWSRVVVGTKVRLGPAELGKPIEAIRASIEASLKRLGRDHVDLLNLHNPIALVSSDSRSMELGLVLSDVARGLQQVVQAGLAHHVGFTGLGETTAIPTSQSESGSGFGLLTTFQPAAQTMGVAVALSVADGVFVVAGVSDGVDITVLV